jgi:hypothetical protein
MKALDNRTVSNASLAISGLLLFAYTLTRANCLSITCDEAITYLNFVRGKVFFPTHFHVLSANNHLLNTWFGILFVDWFGLHDLVLRLPSLLGHLLFLYYSAKLVSSFQNSRLAPAAFLVINANPYLLDYFSLARGYGLSFGLMMAGIYYLFVFQTAGNQQRSATVSILFAIAAAAANLVLVNFCLVLYLVIVAQLLKRTHGQGRWLRVIRSAAIPTAILVAFLLPAIPYLINLKNAGALFFGGARGFWLITINETINTCFYDIWHAHWFRRAIKAGMLLTVVYATVLVGVRSLKNRIDTNTAFLGSIAVLTGLIALSTILQHHLFGTLFLINRTALFLIILFMVLFVFLIAALNSRKAAWLLYAAAVVSLVHLACACNVSSVLDFKSDTDVKALVSDLQKIRAMNAIRGDITLTTLVVPPPTITYYKIVTRADWLKIDFPQTKDLSSLHADYFYILPNALPRVNRDSITIIKVYPTTQSVLAKNRR